MLDRLVGIARNNPRFNITACSPSLLTKILTEEKDSLVAFSKQSLNELIDLEIYYGGRSFDEKDPTTYWTNSDQVITWWKNNVDRKAKMAKLVNESKYSGVDAKLLQRGRYNSALLVRIDLMVGNINRPPPTQLFSTPPSSLPAEIITTSTSPAFKSLEFALPDFLLSFGEAIFGDSCPFVQWEETAANSRNEEAILIDLIPFGTHSLPQLFPCLSLASFIDQLKLYGFHVERFVADEHSSSKEMLRCSHPLLRRARARSPCSTDDDDESTAATTATTARIEALKAVKLLQSLYDAGRKLRKIESEMATLESKRAQQQGVITVPAVEISSGGGCVSESSLNVYGSWRVGEASPGNPFHTPFLPFNLQGNFSSNPTALNNYSNAIQSVVPTALSRLPSAQGVSSISTVVPAEPLLAATPEPCLNYVPPSLPSMSSLCAGSPSMALGRQPDAMQQQGLPQSMLSSLSMIPIPMPVLVPVPVPIQFPSMSSSISADALPSAFPWASNGFNSRMFPPYLPPRNAEE